MRMRFKFLLFLLFVSTILMSQRDIDMGVELQIYPTGVIPGISLEKNIFSHDQLYFRFGANIFNHRDLGVQEKERGYGIGFSLGYKRFFSDDGTKWKLGVKNDFWWNQVKWENPSLQTEGDTKITVLQPTLEVGYSFKKGAYKIIPSLAAGYEINIKTDGAPTGEGAIILLGISIVK